MTLSGLIGLIIWLAGATLLPSASLAAMLPIVGPTQFTHGTGEPQTVTQTFQNCETNTQYRLVILNGTPDGRNRISSARITLNGREVVGPSAFNQRVGQVIRALGTLPLNNTLTVRVASRPGAFLTVSIECTANCLDVQITSPLDGSTVNRVQTLVRGTVTTSAEEAGVVANDQFVALVGEGRFAAVNVPLAIGTTRLHATAKNPCGHRATSEIVVTTEALQESPIILRGFPLIGLTPLSVSLETSATLGVPIAEFRWDVEGDGIIDRVGATLTEVAQTYAQPGVFFPTVTVVAQDGRTFSETTAINVFSLSELDPMLQRRWTGLQAALARGDTEGALRVIAQGAQARYRFNLTLLQSQLTQLATQFPTIRFVQLNEGLAEYEITEFIDGQETRYPVQFVIDEDGLWKVRFF